MLIFHNPPPVPPHHAGAQWVAWRRQRSRLGSVTAFGRECGERKIRSDSRAQRTLSLLFNRDVVAESQRWAAQALGIDASVKIPPRLPMIGGFLGLIGILLLAGPFLREALGKNSLSERSEIFDRHTQRPHTMPSPFDGKIFLYVHRGVRSLCARRRPDSSRLESVRLRSSVRRRLPGGFSADRRHRVARRTL